MKITLPLWAAASCAIALAQTSVSPVSQTASVFTGTADTSRTVTLEAQLNPLNLNPPVTGRPASGTVQLVIRLDRTQTTTTQASSGSVWSTVRANTAQAESISSVQVFRGRSGANGTMVFDLPISPSTNTSTAPNQDFQLASQFDVTSSDSLRALEEMATNPGNFYVSVRTQANPNGLVRGQLGFSAANSAERVEARFGPVNEDLIEIRRLLVAIAFKEGVITTQQRDDMIKALDARQLPK